MDHQHIPTWVFPTVELKVHNPSKRKQAALDTALEEHWAKIQTNPALIMIQLIMEKVHILRIVHVWIAMRDALGISRPDLPGDYPSPIKYSWILTRQLVKTGPQEKLDGYCF